MSVLKKENGFFLPPLYWLRSWPIALESLRFSCLCTDLFFCSLERCFASSSAHPQFVEK